MLINSVATRLRDIEQKENCRVQMSEGRNGLHLNGVSLVERVVQNTWSVNNLPSGVLVIGVTDEQVLGGESIGLNINIGIRDIVDEA